MTKKLINTRLEDSVWKQAKRDALDNDMSLQEWVTYSLLKSHSDSKDE